jgi:hypothetical protein
MKQKVGSVLYDKTTGKWKARVRRSGKQRSRLVETKEEAEAALPGLISELFTAYPVAKTIDAAAAYNKSYYWKNKARLTEQKKQWKKDNPEVHAGIKAAERVRKMRAGVAWGKIKTKQRIAELRTQYPDSSTWHIDHMVPLKGKVGNLQVVCGLHVWYNLQALPVKDNLIKSCYTWDDMPEYTEEDLNELTARNN